MSSESARLQELVSAIYSRMIGEIGDLGKGPQNADERFVYEVELFQQEIGSGASFDQYFVWSGKEEIERIVAQLESLGLKDVAEVTRGAIAYAFPNGVSADPAVLDEQKDFSDDQSRYLAELYREIEHSHAVMTNRLGQYCERHNVRP